MDAIPSALVGICLDACATTLYSPLAGAANTNSRTSPRAGGTTRCDEYSSPAGVDAAWQERHACLERMRTARGAPAKVRLEQEAARRAAGLDAIRAGVAVQGPARNPAAISDWGWNKSWDNHRGRGRCGDCEQCMQRALARKKRKGVSHMAPCRFKVAFLGYTDTEQDIIRDLQYRVD